jgi:nitrogen regulatory protein P-II 1
MSSDGKKRSITVLSEVSLITCIVQRGLGDDIVTAAQDAGAQGATIYFARGTGVRERLGVFGVAVEVEKAVVNIIVANDQVDRIFEHLYIVGELHTPGRGLLYVTPLEKAATYIPVDVLDKLEREGQVKGAT